MERNSSYSVCVTERFLSDGCKPTGWAEGLRVCPLSNPIHQYCRYRVYFSLTDLLLPVMVK